MTAVGGFVDISELVFAAQAGSHFRLCADLGVRLLDHRHDGVRRDVRPGRGDRQAAGVQPDAPPARPQARPRHLVRLAVISTLITCAAEIGGMGLILHYLTGAPYLLMARRQRGRA